MLRETVLNLAPSMLRVVVVATVCASAGACGERFQAAKGQGGGSGTRSVAGAENAGGDPASGGADGASSAAGHEGGGADAGEGGTKPGVGGGAGGGGVAAVGGIGGVGGVGGVGGQPDALPISEERLELWYRADSGVILEDGAVTRWHDGSSHKRHATQSAANYRPKLAPESLNGKLAVLFDGSDDSLEIPEMENDFSQGVSLFMVVRTTMQEGCQGYLELSNGSEVDDLHLGDYRGSLLYEVASPYLNDVMYPLLFDEPIIAVAIHDPDGIAKTRQNGNGVGQMSGMPLPINGIRKRNYLGLTLYDNCVPMKGAISELVLFSRPVSDDELVKMEAHLRKKWACCDAQ